MNPFGPYPEAGDPATTLWDPQSMRDTEPHFPHAPPIDPQLTLWEYGKDDHSQLRPNDTRHQQPLFGHAAFVAETFSIHNTLCQEQLALGLRSAGNCDCVYIYKERYNVGPPKRKTGSASTQLKIDPNRVRVPVPSQDVLHHTPQLPAYIWNQIMKQAKNNGQNRLGRVCRSLRNVLQAALQYEVEEARAEEAREDRKLQIALRLAMVDNLQNNPSPSITAYQPPNPPFPDYIWNTSELDQRGNVISMTPPLDQINHGPTNTASFSSESFYMSDPPRETVPMIPDIQFFQQSTAMPVSEFRGFSEFGPMNWHGGQDSSTHPTSAAHPVPFQIPNWDPRNIPFQGPNHDPYMISFQVPQQDPRTVPSSSSNQNPAFFPMQGPNQHPHIFPSQETIQPPFPMQGPNHHPHTILFPSPNQNLMTFPIQEPNQHPHVIPSQETIHPSFPVYYQIFPADQSQGSFPAPFHTHPH